jgi:hypothetical protein
MNAGASILAGTLLQQRIEIIAAAVVICGLIFELIRRRHLMERYALLWLLAGLTVLVLALWKGLLSTLAHAAGISYLPSALFAVAFLFVLVMLVHFSMTISRLSDQNTMLAQRLALLQQRLDRARDGQLDGDLLDEGGDPLSEGGDPLSEGGDLLEDGQGLAQERPQPAKSKARPEGPSTAAG